MRVEWDVPIKLPDGVTLRADVFMPDDEDRHPAILSHGPYAKGLSFQQGYPDQWRILTSEHPDVETGSSGRFQAWEVVDPEQWVPCGYACVRVDSRGAGRSPGRLDCWSPQEVRDLYECIEWAAAQSWCNGKVGLSGVSYYAINQWQVAALQPPHLAAMCAWEGAADHYRDICFHGGIPSQFLASWYRAQVEVVQHGIGDRGPVSPSNGLRVTGPKTLGDEELRANRVDLGAQAAAHPLDDAFHRERSPDWSKVTVPFLSCANWGGQGLHGRGNFEAFTRAASSRKWLECHGLEHWTHFYTEYGRTLQLRFFDHFLKGEDNGWDREPPVLLQVRRPGELFVERRESSWPIDRTRWTRVYLDAAGCATREIPAGAGQHPPAGALRDAPAADASARFTSLGDGVTFTLPPAQREIEITGPLSARLFISSSTQDADLFLIVRVFDPSDREVHFQGALDPHAPIAQGWLRASHRRLDPERSTELRPYHLHTSREPLEPGRVYELDVEIWPTCIVVPPGHRIALTVQGRDYDYGGEPIHVAWFEMRGCGPFTHDPVDHGVVTVHTGASHPSSLLLPIIPPMDP